MSLLTKASIHGIRAAAFVATHEKAARFVRIHEIAGQLDISFHFLTKILQQLTEAGLMSSSRGPNGGVALARPANQVSVLDIVDSIQGMELFEGCILGLEGCGSTTPCPLHARWAAQRAKILEMYKATKLSDVARLVRSRKLRIADSPLKNLKEDRR